MLHSTFWHRLLLLACWLSSNALALPAWTELQSVLESQSKAVPVSTMVDEDAQLPVRSLGNLLANIPIQEVAAMSLQGFAPFNPHITYPMPHEQPMWLHFRLSADHTDMATGWLLELNRPFIDRAELYTQNSQGQWKMQVAGDNIAHAQWPRRSLNPQFSIPTLTPGSHDFYLRIVNASPLHFGVNLQRTDSMHTQNQHQFLWLGLLLGLMGLMSLASLLMAAIYRNGIYLWYALYVSLGFLSCASYVGVASYAFWPQATWWSDVASNLLLMLAVTVQTQFCRRMFYQSNTARWWQRVITGVIAGSLVCVVWFSQTASATTGVRLANLVMAFNMVLIVSVAVRALRQSGIIAKLWLLAYIPLICIVVLTMADAWGVLTLPWLSVNAPVYALMFEMPVLLIALHLHAKQQHSNTVRETALADLDPLTGFIAAKHFPRLLAQYWSQAQIDQRSLTVAYVQPVIDAAYLEIASEPPSPSQTLMRTVRLLRTVALDKDLVACVKPNLYALILPEARDHSEVKQRLSRLVALGMMTHQQTQHQLPMRFRVAVGSTGGYSGMWHELDAALQAKIAHNEGWDKRSIRDVHNRFERDWDSADLSDFWDKALDAEAIRKVAIHQSTLRATTAPSPPV